VILDADLAALYGVEIRAPNQALKRNAAKFPKILPSASLITEGWQVMEATIVCHDLLKDPISGAGRRVLTYDIGKSVKGASNRFRQISPAPPSRA
jgi:hypothetical protein